jgi:S1-C subfamily serine protease
MHCHQVKETLNADLKRAGKWSRDAVWRYPLPDNLGFALEVDRGNVVREVKEGSAAFVTSLKPGDVLQRLGTVPIHSFADAQFALDRAPKAGAIEVVWRRGEREMNGQLTLAEGWRKTDISWRPSLRRLIPSARLYGTDLSAAEKKALGLPANQLAFRQKDSVADQAREAGIRGGDVIVGIDGRLLEMDVDDFLKYIRSNYLIGDRVTINLFRDGKRLDLAMTLRP